MSLLREAMGCVSSLWPQTVILVTYPVLCQLLHSGECFRHRPLYLTALYSTHDVCASHITRTAHLRAVLCCCVEIIHCICFISTQILDLPGVQASPCTSSSLGV